MLWSKGSRGKNNRCNMVNNKIIIMIGVMLLSIMGVSAGTISDSGGLLKYNTDLICVAGTQQTYDMAGSVFSNVSKFNNVYYVDEGDEIQTIIDSCSSGGCRIVVTEPVIINDTIQMKYHGLELEGITKGGGKYLTDGATLITANSTTMTGKNMINITGSNCVVKNLYLDGSNVTNDGISLDDNGALISDIYVIQNGQSGIKIEAGAGSENVITNVWSGLNGLHGLWINRADTRVDTFVAYRNFNGSGIHITSGGNQISNTHSFYNKYGIAIYSSRNTIINNIFDQSEFNHIYLSSDNFQIAGNTITGNAFYKTSWKGGISGASTTDDSHIYINDTSNNGIKEVIISSNVFDNSGSCVFDYEYGSSRNINRISLVANQYSPIIELVLDKESVRNDVVDIQIIDTSNGFYTEIPRILSPSIENLNDYGLIGYWSMASSTSTKVLDLSKEGNDMTIYGDIILTDSAYFDGDADYLDLGSNLGLTDNFTITAWIKTNNISQNNQVIFAMGSSIFRLVNGKLNFQKGSGTYETIETGVIPSGLVFVAISKSGSSSGDTKLYLNGVPSSALNAIPALDSFSGNYRIGSQVGTTRYFNGTIDDVMLFNRSLSSDEINALYASKRMTTQDSKLDRESGGTIYGDVTISADQLFKLTANTTALTCDVTNAGSIYYNGNDFKHYGCNSTDWNAMY